MQDQPPLPADAPSAQAPAAATQATADLSVPDCAARLAQLFPALFAAQPPRPLKLRIQADIQQRAPGVFTKRALSAFLHRFTTGNPYLKAMAESSERFDLDGHSAGVLDDTHKQAAIAELQRRRALRDERRAAERATQRPSKPALPPQSRDAQATPDAQEPSQPPAPRRPQAQRPQRPQRPERPPMRQAEAQAYQLSEAEGAARAGRAALLRAFESSTLTTVNFCVLKRIDATQLESTLALARDERAKSMGTPTKSVPDHQQGRVGAPRKPDHRSP